MPALTLTTEGVPATASHTATTEAAPLRPPISPITPPLNASQPPPPPTSALPDPALPPAPPRGDLSAHDRRAYAHPTQPDQAAAGAVVPPPAAPVVLDENPDAIALRSAISILQLQRARAAADLQVLARAKRAALADPAAFAADLAAGRVRTGSRGLYGRPGTGETPSESESESESETGDEEPGDARDGDREGRAAGATRGTAGDADADVEMTVAASSREGEAAAWKEAEARRRRRRKGKGKSTADSPAGGRRDWQTLPGPQNVVRCPPVNWAQYGVVGASLDKLHAEQRAAPSLGAPAVLGPGGTYEFRAGDALPPGGEQRRLVGVAAPYHPTKDRIEKKRGGRR
ncbi:hypothetical protein P8C59_004081 [Phyllachora maydis]|uniref:Uncharacterized protein n=1 Tax=Phyllachora maydis TaxID=1825666 RepID=A0AAD9I3A4_9PEZI|nr:hypothetical protein P8C59_004081 [Phyllachora maydis]